MDKRCLIRVLPALVLGHSFAGQAAAPESHQAKASAWERSAALGLTLTRGNSRTLLFTGNILATYKTNRTELDLGADATYGETRDPDTNEDNKTAESLHGFFQYNRLFTERVFGYARFDALHDAVADVEYRLSISAGAGYYFFKSPRTTLRAELGPGFVYEKQGRETEGYVTLRLAERFEHKFSERARLWQTIEVLPQVNDWDNYLVNAELGVEAALTERLSLRTLLQDTYDNQPAPGRMKNDLKLISALAYKF